MEAWSLTARGSTWSALTFPCNLAVVPALRFSHESVARAPIRARRVSMRVASWNWRWTGIQARSGAAVAVSAAPRAVFLQLELLIQLRTTRRQPTEATINADTPPAYPVDRTGIHFASERFQFLDDFDGASRPFVQA